MRARLLVVDDEALLMEALCRTLEPEGYEVVGFTSPLDAVASLRQQAYDILLTDLMMPEMDGITLLRTALEIEPDLVGLLMTGQGTVATAVDAMKVGALDYVLKPFKLSAIRPVLARALTVRRLRMENIRLRESVAIYELSRSLARTLDAGTILETIADAAFAQSHAHAVRVFVGGVGQKALRPAVARSLAAVPDAGRTVPITDDLLAWADRSRDWLAQIEFGSPAEPAPGLAESSACLSLPMLAGGRLAGLLVFEPAPGRSIAAGQIKALSVLAGAGAAALELSTLVDRLRRTNDELRQVAWAASHDLQEPLRMVTLYTQLFAERHRGSLDAKSEELVSYAVEGAGRILEMLRELRAYVEAGDGAPTADARAEGGRALAVALDRHQSAIDASGARIRVATLPVVRMTETHLSEVLTRLLDNALKFRRRDEPPDVDVTATHDAGMWTFTIADRGIGIDSAYHAQIFELFRRLNRREDYPGSGMGLPICRRIVEAFGGSLWVESEKESGARFSFTVPACTRTG